MCLYTNDDKIKIAESPVKCIKIVKRRVTHSGVTYTSIFTDLYDIEPVQYTIGETVKDTEPVTSAPHSKKIRKLLYARKTNYWCKMRYKVESGLHSYDPNHNGWKELAAWCIRHYYGRHEELLGPGVKFVLLECEIPAGAKYLEGYHNDTDATDDFGYVSDRLKVIKAHDILYSDHWREFKVE